MSDVEYVLSLSWILLADVGKFWYTFKSINGEVFQAPIGNLKLAQKEEVDKKILNGEKASSPVRKFVTVRQGNCSDHGFLFDECQGLETSRCEPVYPNSARLHCVL
jgi:hypothetical protein